MSSNPKANLTAKSGQRGGARQGAGRPKGSGKFKEATKPIRVPVGSIPIIQDYLARYNSRTSAKPKAAVSDEVGNIVAFEAVSGHLELPLHSSKVAAGNPSPAEDHVDDTLDLNDYLVERPDSTYMLRVEGESMLDAGILPNDILIVDRALDASHNKIVIAAVDGQLTVKRLFSRGGIIKLIPENKNYPTIELEDEAQLVIWGVVIGSIRKFQAL